MAVYINRTFIFCTLSSAHLVHKSIYDIYLQDNKTLVLHDVTVERVKQKGGSDQSGRSTPLVDSHQGHGGENSHDSGTLELLPEGKVV